MTRKEKLLKQDKQNIIYIHIITDTDSRLYSRLTIPYLLISDVTGKIIKSKKLYEFDEDKLEDILFDTYDVMKQIFV